MKAKILLGAILALAGFVISAQSDAADFRKLYAFKGPPDGNYPVGIAVDANGEVFGATRSGGNVSASACGATNYANQVDGVSYPGCGVIYEITAGPQAAETVLYKFMGGADGGWPSGLVALKGGHLYGGTEYGGSVNPTACANGCGIVYDFKVATKKLEPIHSFSGAADGGDIYTGVIRAANGVLYGTGNGVEGGDGPPTIYSLTPPASANGAWTLADLPTPNPTPIFGSLAVDGAGNLYGFWDNVSNGVKSCGIYELAMGASGFTYIPLATFVTVNCGASGLGHLGVTVFTPKNGSVTLYGVTPNGGANSLGSIFSLDPATQAFTTLYSFTGGPDGALPMQTIGVDAKGEIYGAAFSGGSTANCSASIASVPAGCGTAFAFNPASAKFKLLHTFGGKDGSHPYGVRYVPTQSAVYGVTLSGGSLKDCVVANFPLSGCGTVFEITALP